MLPFTRLWYFWLCSQKAPHFRYITWPKINACSFRLFRKVGWWKGVLLILKYEFIVRLSRHRLRLLFFPSLKFLWLLFPQWGCEYLVWLCRMCLHQLFSRSDNILSFSTCWLRPSSSVFINMYLLYYSSVAILLSPEQTRNLN